MSTVVQLRYSDLVVQLRKNRQFLLLLGTASYTDSAIVMVNVIGPATVLSDILSGSWHQKLIDHIQTIYRYIMMPIGPK